MNELPLAIGYNKIFGGLLLVSGVFILGVAVLVGQLFPQAITGGILTLVSLGYLTQPALVIAPREVQMKNLFGMTLRTHPFERLSQLTVVDGALDVNGTRVRTARWLLDGGDWNRLETMLRERRQ
jgi:hypothetical protein